MFDCDKRRIQGIIKVTTILSVLMWIVLYFAGKDSWWYDTIVTFPLGMWFSFFRENIELRMRTMRFGCIVSALILLFIGWHILFGNDSFGVCASLFCLMLVVTSTRIKMDNKVLQWLGTHSFAIYIMQRFPMNLYQNYGFAVNPYLFSILSIPSVLFIAYVFDQLLLKVDKVLHN